MSEQINIISNKDALRDKIHDIHNYLRNNGASHGMNALKIFNVLYGLKKIEEANLLDSVNLKQPECEFSNLVRLADGTHDEELSELIYNTILNSIAKSNVNTLLSCVIPNNISGSTFAYLIKEINKITLIENKCNVLLSGKIYEYFVGRDKNTISKLGAYFTDKHITKYIYEKIKPEIYEDGSIGTMIDMFGGSGGFTTSYIEYLNNNYDIDWSSEIEKIHHYDINEDVIKSAGLELFCLTGTIPSMSNIKYNNSFKDEFTDINGQKITYDYVITNPPYGGNVDKKLNYQIKRDAVKKTIKEMLKQNKDSNLSKQLKTIIEQEKAEKLEQDKIKVSINTCSNRISQFATENNLKGNDKEACSLMLMMELLAENGTCVGVLKEGIFFNSKYKDLRKHLIENYNVSEIISVPQDQFENTNTKTSIIIFSNTGPTEEIIFREMIIKKIEENVFEMIEPNLVLTEHEGDISDVGDNFVSKASIEDILENKTHSFNSKDYKKK